MTLKADRINQLLVLPSAAQAAEAALKHAMNNPLPVEYASSFVQANQSLMLHLASELLSESGRNADFQRFAELAQAQQEYLQQMGTLWLGTLMQSGAEAVQPAKGDRRFAAEEWQQSPLHEFLKQSYLINTRYVNNLIDRSTVDERTRRRLTFFARQILDALSPSNYLAANPQSLRLAMETGGESLATGIKNLIDDVGRGRISMSDEKAFEVGGNLAITPGAVILENELIQLIQYRPLTDTVGKRPLVMVPPAINKFYVLDLQPANSFVRYAVEQGHTVFMLSWRNIGTEQGHLTWDDYLELGIMRAIDVALAVTGADQANVLGFCVGGTMLGCAAAVLAARREDKIASLTFLTTMLIKGDVHFTLAASGHIAGVINPASRNKRNFWIDGELDAPERWLETAREVPGSWWTHWSGWLAHHAGEQVPARATLGSPEFSPLEPAPGRYVAARTD
jgi:polyhydroxyalkanoate synthase subunit PhaC